MGEPCVTENAKIYYYHLGVRNKGRSTALNCRGYVDSIYEYKDAGYERINNFIAMPIYWARENRPETFIEPEQVKFLDLAKVEDTYDIVRRENIFKIWFREYSDTDRLYSGKYKINIILYAENAKSLSTSLYINWSGRWKAKYSDMLKELTISDKPSI